MEFKFGFSPDIHADDNPFIIKMPDEAAVLENGLGNVLYSAMKMNSKNIAQYVVETEESQTYEDLLDLCIRVAVNLKKLHLSEDDIVGLCMENHKHSCVPYIAALFLGYKIVALDHAVTAEDKAALLLTVTPKIIFVDEELLPDLVKSLNISKLNIELVVIGPNYNGPNSFAQFLSASEEEINNFQPKKVESNKGTAIILFSSGTTGPSKGICISHFALLCRTRGRFDAVSLSFSELIWVSYAILLFITLRSGSTIVVMKHFEAEKIWPIVYKYKISFIFASVFQTAAIIESDIPEGIDISSLRHLLIGGSSLPPAIFEKVRARLPHVITLQGYGLTEMGGTVLSFKQGEYRLQCNKPKSCGRPLPGIWYKVVDPETEKILGPGESGELRLKSKLAMVGYHKIDSSAAYDSEGWLKTGDVVQYDEDHCFFIVDRLKEIILFRDWIVSPLNIEHNLMAHPAVEKAAVIGIPHGADSELPMGIVTLKKNCSASPKELEDYVEERVIDRQRLRGGVRIISEMPLTTTGKIQKRILRTWWLEGKI